MIYEAMLQVMKKGSIKILKAIRSIRLAWALFVIFTIKSFRLL